MLAWPWESKFCPSHACFVTKPNNALRIFWYHTKGQSLCYSDANSAWRATPPSVWNLSSKLPTPFETRRLQQISVYNVWIIRDSEKVQLRRIGSHHGLSIELQMLTLPLSLQRVAQKAMFCFWIKINFNRVKSAAKFISVKTSCDKVVAQPFPLSNGP